MGDAGEGGHPFEMADSLIGLPESFIPEYVGDGFEVLF